MMLGQTGLEWVGPLLELAKSGSFAVLAFYLIVIHLPRLEDRYRDERQQFRQDILDKLESIDRQVRERRE